MSAIQADIEAQLAAVEPAVEVLLAEVVRRIATADPAISQITQGHFFLVDAVALIGDETTVRRRIDEYAAAGITEIGVVVPSLERPSGRRTLEALAPA